MYRREINPIDWVALVLAAVGALNWGLVGLFHFNLVHAILGGIPALEDAVYVIVGLAGLWLIALMARLASRGVDRVTTS